MASLSPGILLKLLHGMKAGAPKPFGDHRRALLQVTGIVPVGLDEDGLWPGRGFYVEVSDSSHSMYASLPPGEGDLVLSNKVRLGQLIRVDGFEPGAQVPVIRGARPVPGLHPLIGRPGSIAGFEGKEMKETSAHKRRSSWAVEARTGGGGLSTLLGEEGSPKRLGFYRSAERKDPSVVLERKSSFGSMIGGCKKIQSERRLTITMRSLRKDKKSMAQNLPLNETRAEIPSLSTTYDIDKSQAPRRERYQMTPPEKLLALEKEAVNMRATTRKTVLGALRNASAAETLVKMLKVFSTLSSSAKANAPAAFFEQFLSFHQDMSQAVSEMEASLSASRINQLTFGESDQDSSFGSLIELARDVQSEAESWFMDFLEAATRSGFRKSSDSQVRECCCCPQSLVARVVAWMEEEMHLVDSRATRLVSLLKN